MINNIIDKIEIDDSKTHVDLLNLKKQDRSLSPPRGNRNSNLNLALFKISIASKASNISLKNNYNVR